MNTRIFEIMHAALDHKDDTGVLAALLVVIDKVSADMVFENDIAKRDRLQLLIEEAIVLATNCLPDEVRKQMIVMGKAFLRDTDDA